MSDSSTSYTSTEPTAVSAFENYQELLRRCADVSEWAVESVREGENTRGLLNLEIRDLNLSLSEEFHRLQLNLDTFDRQLHDGRVRNDKIMAEKMEKAEKIMCKALSSSSLLKEIELFEKKMEILKESILSLHKDYFNYDKNVDVADVLSQVTDLSYCTQKKEKELYQLFYGPKAVHKPADVLQKAIESLLGIQSSDQAILDEAKAIAQELRPLRNAAVNDNLLELLGIDRNLTSGASSNQKTPEQPVSSVLGTSSASASSSSSSATGTSSVSSSSAAPPSKKKHGGLKITNSENLEWHSDSKVAKCKCTVCASTPDGSTEHNGSTEKSYTSKGKTSSVSSFST